MNLNRRTFVAGLFAPAIVPITSLMPLQYLRDPNILWYKGVMLADEAFYYAPYIPFEIVKTQVHATTRMLSDKWVSENHQMLQHVYDIDAISKEIERLYG